MIISFTCSSSRAHPDDYIERTPLIDNEGERLFPSFAKRGDRMSSSLLRKGTGGEGIEPIRLSDINTAKPFKFKFALH